MSGDVNDPVVDDAARPETGSPGEFGQLYKTGEGAPWKRADLTLDEQELLDRPDPTMPGAAHAKYAEAAAYHASRAAANLASVRLGLVGLDEIGVVP